MRLLIMGGSGFLSGTLARAAIATGWEVSAVTRGSKPIPTGIRPVVADRTVEGSLEVALGSTDDWDLVVDCIGFNERDAQQDLKLFAGRCASFVFISTDFVYHPAFRCVPQAEADAVYSTDGYGGDKRAAEMVFVSNGAQALPWTIFRPSHIFGPGSQLGCLPLHGRDADLINRLRRTEPLRLVNGGSYQQHPIYAPDLAEAILAAPQHAAACAGSIFNISNPEIFPSLRYYEIVAELLGVQLRLESVNETEFLTQHPDKAPFCCERVYDLTRLNQSGLPVPKTSLRDGLARQIEFLENPVAPA